MDVDDPSNQAVTAASQETQTAIREKKRQELQQAREELKEMVDDLPDGLQELGCDITHFGEELEWDINRIEDEHQSPEKRHKSALEVFKKRWDDAKKEFEQSFYNYPQRPARDKAASLYNPVEEFMIESQTLQQTLEVEIDHPEVSFKKYLDSIRERLDDHKWTGHCLKRALDETVEKLEKVFKRVNELEKLAGQ